MECMCPNCGKKIKNGELAFDLTAFLQKRVLEEIEKAQWKDADVMNQVKDGCNIYFNHWMNNGYPLKVSEKELWKYPEVSDGGDLTKEKQVLYSIPVQKITAKTVKDDCTEGDEEIKKAFTDWLEKNQELGKKTYMLRLVKSGDGDICFDEIQYQTEIIANKRICPECGSEMSYYAGRYQEWTLTVLGGPRVSKSTALTSCAAAFMDRNDDLIRWDIHPTDAGSEFFIKNYLTEYKAGRELKATETQNDKIPRLTFRVTIGKETARKKKYLCLTFVDLPGEFNNEKGLAPELQERYRNIFQNIDFVWYCTDPGEIEQLQGEIVRNELGYDEKKIIETDRIKDNMRRLSAYFSHSNRKVPVAYILGKTDAAAILPEDKRRYGLYDENGGEPTLPFDVRSFFRRSEKVKQYMMNKNTGGLVNEFEKMFPERCYIATSAYGYNPKKVDAEKEHVKKPYHCKEAFYWMLALRNCIDVKVEHHVSGLFGIGAKTHVIEGRLTELDDEVREKAYKNLYMSGNYTI